MLNVDWNLALARLSFLDGYLRHMKQEVAMKNEALFNPAHDAREGRSRAVPARGAQRDERTVPRWPPHRRFWHRSPAPAPASAPAPPAPAKPQAAGAAEDDARDQLVA